MERYLHLQAMPNSPLTPLTPLSENTKFEFNFGGDGSLNEYIDSVRKEHKVEQQRKKLLECANRKFPKKLYSMQPKRYSKEFLEILNVFEKHERIENHKQQQVAAKKVTNKAPSIKITCRTPTRNNKNQIRTPLKPRNQSVRQNVSLELIGTIQHQKFTQQQAVHQDCETKLNRIFRPGSPVAAKPLSPRVSNILHHCGLALYCDLFQKEEIDIFTFCQLTLQDLHQMGILNQKHCAILTHEIYYAGQYI